MAFLDDVYVSTKPDRTGDAHAAAGKHMHSKGRHLFAPREDQDLEFPR